MLRYASLRAKPAPRAEVRVNPPRVLLADDSPLILRLLEKELTAAGFAISCARDGLEAVEKALAEDVAMVILDVTMPRMNGYQACRLLKTETLTRHLPVVILTSRDQAADRYWGQETGADYYITKDAEPGRIVELVRRILAQPPGIPRPRPPGAARSSVDILARVNELLDRKLYEATVLSEIGRVARNLVHFDETFASVMALVGRVLDFAVGGIAFVEEEGADVLLAQPRRLGEAALRQATDWFRQALVRERGGEPADVAVRLLPALPEAPEEPEIADFAAIPVVSGQRLAAVLLLGGRAVARLTSESESFLHQVANQAHMVLANSRLFERVRNLSVRDSLTGLFNHRYTMELLGREMDRGERYPQPLSLLMIDIDHFKLVNDSFGHLAGDAVLREVTRVIATGLRSVDSLGRYGGEEFAAILPHTAIDQARVIAERVRFNVEQAAFTVQGRQVPVTVSIGVASHPAAGVATAAELVRAADQALYEAKQAGRNRVA
jgi:two-component system cell cycle response regulator